MIDRLTINYLIESIKAVHENPVKLNLPKWTRMGSKKLSFLKKLIR